MTTEQEGIEGVRGSRTLAPFPAAAAKGWLPWGVLAPVLALVFVAAPAIAATLLLHRYGLVDAEGEPLGIKGLVAFLLLPFLGMLAVVLLWVWRVERRPLASIGLVGDRGLVRFLRGWVLGIGMSGAIVATIACLGGYDAGAFAPAMAAPAAVFAIFILLLAFGVQASVEEVLFRGWLLSVLTSRWGALAAVAVTSLVFAFLHFSPGQHWVMTLNMVLFSLFPCVLAISTREIWTVMGWHSGWNWLLAVGFATPVTGLNTGLPALLVAMTPAGGPALNGGVAGPEGSLVTTVAFVAGILLILAKRRAVPLVSL